MRDLDRREEGVRTGGCLFPLFACTVSLADKVYADDRSASGFVFWPCPLPLAYHFPV